MIGKNKVFLPNLFPHKKRIIEEMERKKAADDLAKKSTIAKLKAK